MSSRVKKKIMKAEKTSYGGNHLPPLEEVESFGASVANSEEEEACFSGALNRSTSPTGAESRVDECISNSKPSERDGVVGDGVSEDQLFPWKEELECLVRGGLPKDLRGEVKLEF